MGLQVLHSNIFVENTCCSHCCKVFQSDDLLVEHIALTHMVSLLKYTHLECQRVVKDQLACHLGSHHADQQHFHTELILQDNILSPSTSPAVRRQRKKHPKNEINLEPTERVLRSTPDHFQCIQCSLFFSNEGLLEMHRKMQHSPNNFMCLTCGIILSDYKVSNKHKEMYFF